MSRRKPRQDILLVPPSHFAHVAELRRRSSPRFCRVEDSLVVVFTAVAHAMCDSPAHYYHNSSGHYTQNDDAGVADAGHS